MFEGVDHPLWPVKIVISVNKARVIYFHSEPERDRWYDKLKEVSGCCNVDEYYCQIKELGKGHFGVVYLSEHKKTKEKVAIKCVKKQLMTSNEMAQQHNEISVLKMCQHPNICRMVDNFENERSIYVVLEYLEGGDLYDFMLKRGFDLPEKMALKFSYELCCSLQYLHSYGIVHRDLKLENIMMTKRDDSGVPKLVDFGLAKIIGPDEYASEPFGTVAYAAPEVIKG